MNSPMDEMFGWLGNLNDEAVSEIVGPALDFVEVVAANEKLQKLIGMSIDAFAAAWGRLHASLVDSGISREVVDHMLVQMAGSGSTMAKMMAAIGTEQNAKASKKPEAA